MSEAEIIRDPWSAVRDRAHHGSGGHGAHRFSPRCPPKEVWSAHRTQTGITRREYDACMSGATQASGLTLEDPVSFDEPVTLSVLRSAGAFHPPQSYRPS